jgi:arsenate reductase (thioredoxin)
MNTTNEKFKILFLCNGNSARSIFAEYLIRRIAPNKFESFSAGSNPIGTVNPMTMRVLMDLYKIDATGARSKSWEEFKDTTFDFVVTVCEHQRENCPVWPGQPMVSHWASDDPAAFVGDADKTFNIFRIVAQQIYRRLDLFCSLPLEKLDKMRVQELMSDISFVGKRMSLTQEIPTIKS